MTYVTHDRTVLAEARDADDESSQRGVAAARPGGNARTVGGGSSSAPSLSRRSKRPRPTLQGQGGSARAVVWGEPCPACRGGEEEPSSPGTPTGNPAESVSRGSCGPCRGGPEPGGGGGAGEGPVKPGQYVYLRVPAAEDLERSLTSEGEFAAPRPGGLFGSALAGDRVRVWRDGGGGGSGGSDAGSFCEADVVQFNAASGKHRLRFVLDGAVEDIELMKPPDDESDGGGGSRRQAAGGGLNKRVGSGGAGSGRGVRWLQRRTRRRARDAIRRNASGLCEGPSGEARGLVGDQHDPSAQRQENWRWALSRWRWDLGQRDGYYPGRGREARRGAAPMDKSQGVDGGSRDAECTGVPLAGDGMFPPIGKVLAVERRDVDTGERVIEGDDNGAEAGGKGRATEVVLKVARLWYPQDTRRGMDPFVHGKAEVFEACRMVHPRKVGGACACAQGSSRGPGETETTARSGGQGLTRRGASSPCENQAAPCCCKLDSERPLAASLKVEPVTLWVRACEAHRLASVHPCIDGRLNPCAGKVVNDPYQPQAEFFISHRYCLEADAYFPLESSRNSSTGGCAAVGVEMGALGSPGGAREGGLHRLPSPRSTKARLLNRRVSDSMLDLPPKWHPLKKRMSLDQGASLSPAGSGRDSPVVGWESAISRSSRADSGASITSGRSTAVDPVVGSPRESSQDGSDPRRIFLCHRCRHALPSSRLQQCMGRGCGNRFCAPCASERSGGLSSGGGGVKGRPRVARWPTHQLPLPPREAFGGGADVGGGRSGCETAEPWTGPCCRGRCGCRECVAGADQGLLSNWRSRNGLASAVTTAGPLGPARLLRKAGGAPQAAAAAASTPKKMVGWSGWQGRSHLVKDAPESVEGGRPNGHIVAEGGRGRGPLSCVDEGTAHAGYQTEGERGMSVDADVGVDVAAADDARVEWCRSCGGPGPAGSLSRCYYCRGGVHGSGCRRFEEVLTQARLAEFGLGSAGQFATPPAGEGAVGHGVAVCVRGRWRAGLILCWSPSLAAHYIRYVDGWEAGEQGRGAASGLDAVPWEGEWVALPPGPGTTTPGKPTRVGSAGGTGESTKRFASVVRATGVRWPLVEIALRLFPPPQRPRSGATGRAPTATAAVEGARAASPGGSSAARGLLLFHQPEVTKPPPESRSASKVLKALLKQNFLASQAAEATGTGRKSAADSNQYRPPAVAIPSGVASGRPSARVCDGDGDGDSREAGNRNGPDDSGGEEERRLWVCRACLEAKLQRLQRRVRAQFQAPNEEGAEEAPGGSEDGGSTAAVASSGASRAPDYCCAAKETPTTPSRSSLPACATLAGVGNGTPKSARSPQRPPLAAGETAAGVAKNGGGGEHSSGAPFVSPAAGGGNRGRDTDSKKKRPREDSETELAVTGASVDESVRGETGGREGDESTGGRESDRGMSITAAAAAAAAAVATAAEPTAARTTEAGGSRLACRARRDRRLRWLPAGNPASARSFAFEAGFVSDIADLHARGGPTASGANIGSSRSGSRGGRKRPRPPPVARAFSHLLGTLETQAALAFALPADVSGLDRDMAAFFSGSAHTGEDTDAAAAVAGGGGGPLDDELQNSRSVVLVDGTAAAAAAAAAAAVARGGQRGSQTSLAVTSAAEPGAAELVPQQQQQQGDEVVVVSGWGSGGAESCSSVGGVGGGEYGAAATAAAAAAAILPEIPAGFSSVKEVDLESSARVRPLDTSSKLRRRSSSFGEGKVMSLVVRNFARGCGTCTCRTSLEQSIKAELPGGVALREIFARDTSQRAGVSCPPTCLYACGQR